ncbi:MAG: LAGLIDADG family homing endonuclease, partial [bacterium]
NFSVKETHNYLVNGIVVKNCQSYAPNHVCIVTPERLGLCGAYTWLDCKASHQLNPHGPNEPVKKGKCLDPVKGQWDGVNEYLLRKSNRNLERFNAYSMVEDPMTSCVVGDTELIINGKSIKIEDFVNSHRGKEDYTKCSALTLKEGKAKEEPIVAMQRFLAPETLIKLRTKSGIELILTPNHELAVDRWERLGWVRADKVEIGDRIISLSRLGLPSTLPEMVDILPDDFRVADHDLIEKIKTQLISKYGSLRKALNHIPIKLPSGIKSIKIGDLKTIASHLGVDWGVMKTQIKTVNAASSFVKLPERLSEDIFYLMGLIASDGSITRRGKYEYHIDFINTNERLGEVFTSTYLHSFPGRNVDMIKRKETVSKIRGRIIKPTKPCFHYYLNNPVLGYLCEYFGIPVSHNVRWNLGRMLNLPKSHIAAFVAGLFDGDGSVRLRRYQDKWVVGEGYLCIFAKNAARHLQLLLKRLGIAGNLRKDRQVWKIELHGSNLSHFASVIPSKHPQKQKLLMKIFQLTSSSSKLDKSQREVLPYHVGRAVAALSVSQELLSPTTLFYYKTGRSRPVASNVQKVLQADVLSKPEEKKFPDILRAGLNTDYYLDAITHKEEVKNEGKYDYVYNLTLKNVHAYFVNGGPLIKNCGCFECITAVLPETNGVMIVNREFTGMTPVGMAFSTMAGSVGGGVQTPGFIGMGKMYITSEKFISAEGGIRRVVWMPQELKEEIKERLEKRLAEIGEPELMDKIATEKDAETSEELVKFLQEKQHPALSLEPMM